MPKLPPSRRTVALLTWMVAFSVCSVLFGLPTARINTFVWVVLAVLAFGVDRPRSTMRSFATTWLPLFAALAAYDRLRGASDERIDTAHSWPQLDIDQWLGGGTTPSEHLQAWLWDPTGPGWWDYAAWAVYQSHFFVPLLLAVLLWSIRHRLAAPYVVGVGVLSWMALATYAAYPAQPPWMTGRDGLSGDVDRIVRQMWDDIGVERASKVFTTERAAGSRYSNPVAALPSLHAAFPMLIAGFLWGTRRWLDVVLGGYVLAMGLTLVYAGEHFTFDVVLGWLYALAVVVAARRYQRGRPSEYGTASVPHFDEGGDFGTDPEAASRSRSTSLPQIEVTRS